MQLEIWSDIVCPWCAIGRARLHTALDDFAHRDEVEITWRSFELDPTAPRRVEGPYVTRLAEKYGQAEADAQTMIDRMTSLAADEGMTFRFDRAVPGNSFDAHRALHLAEDRGIQDAVKARLLAGYLEQGEAIGEHDVLVRLAAEAGLDSDEAREVLAGEAYTDRVRADEAQAREFGISGVPFFVLDRRFAVSGAQPAEVLGQALQQAWDARTPFEVVGATAGAAANHEHDHAAGEACADGSCAV